MGAPAVVMGDRVTGICPNHLIPGPMGAPMPSPPLPFSAPLTMGLVSTVLIGGKPAAVMGSSGFNVPPHVGLHPSDPFLAPPMQRGQVLSGSPTVLIGGQPAATAQSSCTCCAVPGTIVPTVATVLIG
ncbi:MAG: PAAR domain-containing protein [Candidatus Dormibacteraeota bacterium]|nr:PAAR domain-containing protein [Candidatus Dormibacteraeota bacterium]MBO0744324.1 PAAR domain-containing protein [Candidatus Dormibacteraeota bacterium]